MILMTSAQYGHMTGGQCIEEEDPRYRGCSNDVLPLFDKWCSGKQECRFDTSDKVLERLNVNCPRFIRTFTKLEHTCIKGQSNIHIYVHVHLQKGLLTESGRASWADTIYAFDVPASM